MKIDNQLLGYLVEIKEDTSSIKEHLRQLNSKVATNVNRIENNNKNIENINIKLAKWGGIFVAVVFIVQILLVKLNII